MLSVFAGGQVVRRLVLFGFHYAPEKTESNLLDKMMSEEIAGIIRKVRIFCNGAVIACVIQFLCFACIVYCSTDQLLLQVPLCTNWKQ